MAYRTLTRQACNLRVGDLIQHDSAISGPWSEEVVAVDLYSRTSKRDGVKIPFISGQSFVGLWTRRGCQYPDWTQKFTIKRKVGK
jgi:hypothetical protein